MYDEWLENMDNGTLKGVIFLDIKKTFDSVNHDILITKMNKNFGIIAMKPNWFRSYLTNREQQSIINGQLSSKKMITCRVPPGINPKATFVSIIH